MKVKWGVIGAGGIADRRTIPGMLLAKNAELEAVMEVSIPLAEKIASKYNVKKAYDNVEDLLKDPQIRAVYIASPVLFHKEQAVKAASYGKHILLEKPVALTVSEGLDVVKACRDNGILAASGLVMRFHTLHGKMKEMINNGELGQIVSCRAQLTCWYPEIQNAWRQKMSMSGGGAIMDLAVHCIDLIQYVTGSRAKRIAALVGTKTFGYEVDDSASLLFETENGAYCYVDANFNIPDAAARNRFEVYGTGGCMLAEGTINQVEGGSLNVTLEDTSAGYDAVQDRKTDNSFEIGFEPGNMYTREIESFSDSILRSKPVEVPIEDAIQVHRVIEAAIGSAKTGTFIDLN